MEDVDGEEMPGAIVEAFLEREEGVRALLEELEKLTIEAVTRRSATAFAIWPTATSQCFTP